MTILQSQLKPIFECAVCGGSDLISAIKLPQLPLTALYTGQPSIAPAVAYDQELLFCSRCGHAQIGYQIAPSLLYDQSYGFRTSASATARKGTEFFLNVLKQVTDSRQFKCVVDWGCNDLYLLNKLQGWAHLRIGIDPIWESREQDVDEPDVEVIGQVIENIDLESRLPARPDLIVCRHTIEHITAPKAALQKVFDIAVEDAVFLFETPGFDALVRKYRFDQIFHQHVQYFNLTTFQYLLREIGAEYLGSWENYHDWGAMLIAFRKPKKQLPFQDVSPTPFSQAEIIRRYCFFQQQMFTVSQMLSTFDKSDPIYGYGAGQMLPVLAYHLQNDLACLTAIIDDDPAKDGWYYQNLIPPIRFAGHIKDLQDATVLITAVDNFQPIMSKLLTQRPRHIITPLNVF